MRARSALIAALAGVVLAAGPGFAQRDDAARLLASGRQAFEAGNYEKARTDLWAYLEATASLTGASRLPQAEALFTIARMEPDAGVAAQHYRTIADEYPASTVADEAIFRLGTYALVSGRPEEARERFLAIKQNYPFSRLQGEIPLWVGRTYLAEDRHQAATDAMIEGYSRVRTQDLPYELTAAQRDALAAEYAYWLATAFQQEGDRQTAIQYWSLLALDFASSPQAADARAALAAAGRPVAEPASRRADGDEAPARGEPLAREEAPAREERPVAREETPAREERPVVREETPAREGTRTAREEAPAREEATAARREPPRETRTETARTEPARAVTPPAEETGPPPPSLAAGTVFLQVGAFSSATRAADLSKRLRADGFASSVEIGIVNGQGFYRVRVGPYRLPTEAEALRDTETRLAQLGYPARQVAAGS